MAKVIVHNPRPKARRPKRRPARKATPAKRRNPHVSAIRRPRRNPNPLTKVKGAAIAAVPMLTGMIATRAATSMALKENDTGYKGYLANVGVALVLGMGANMLGAKKLGAGMIVGGVAATMLRIVGDQWPKTTQYLTDYVPTGMNQGAPWQYRPGFADYVPQPLGPQQTFQGPSAQAAGPAPPLAQAQAA